MTEGKKKTRKASGEANNLVTVDANKLREALKHTFEGVTMLFDCIGLNVPVGEPVPEQEEKPEEMHPTEQVEAVPVKEAEPVQAEEQLTEAETASAESNPEEKQQADLPSEATTSPAVATVTQDDITRIIVRKIKQDRSNNEKIGSILKAYGVAKVSDLPVTKYEAFQTDLSQI